MPQDERRAPLPEISDIFVPYALLPNISLSLTLALEQHPVCPVLTTRCDQEARALSPNHHRLIHRP
eukprot:scaffold3776_cov192-Alexandrium_tamarense.AAC.15